MEVPVALRGAIEALLFVSDEPVSVARIAKVLEQDEPGIVAALTAIAEEYRVAERGFQLREVAGGWRLYTHPAYHERVESYVLSWDTRRLSQAALEALAVIAYHQPVTRSGVNAVRGVNSEGVISSLVDKGLVREVGRDRNQGNAVLFGTTRTFLEKFGLRDISELPPLEEFSPDPQTERAIRERLGALDGSSLEDAPESVEASAEGSDGEVREFDPGTWVTDKVEMPDAPGDADTPRDADAPGDADAPDAGDEIAEVD